MSNTEQMTDEKLAEFDAAAADDRWSLNAFWYKKLRERLRIADLKALEVLAPICSLFT